MNAQMKQSKERALKEEIREAVKEIVVVIGVSRAVLEMDKPGTGNLMLDVLAEEIGKLRSPGPAAVATRKAMLSQPMAGKSDEEIAATRERAVAALEAKGYTVINTLFTDEWYSKEAMESRGVEQIPLCFLAKSLENMSLCHAAYFCKGWEDAWGCRIEHDAAKAYGLEIIYEE